MSGVEIAGLVLGAFPILLHALEQYRRGAENLKDWWLIRRAYEKCEQDLRYHAVLFEDNLERCLLPLVADDDEMRSLMADPAGDKWGDDDLEARLKLRLPKSYDVFLGIMKIINELMEALKKELGVRNLNVQVKFDPSHKIIKGIAARKDFFSIENFDFQTQRIKFSLRKSSRERLFTQLQEANDRLGNLLESNDQTATTRLTVETARTSSKINTNIQQYWRHANRLHKAFSKAHQCDCASHVVNLQLVQQPAKKIEFDMLVSVQHASGNELWRDVKVQATLEPIVDTIAADTNQVNVGQTGPRVRFVAPSNSADSQTSTHQTALIKNYCAALSTPCSTCFGYMAEDGHRFTVYPRSDTPRKPNIPTMSLEKLLLDSNVLTRRKRYHLASTIAGWFSRLGSTPWLKSPLKSSIVFPHTSPLNATALDSLYIRRELSKDRTESETYTIAALGICLLELCFGMPLESNWFRKQLPAGDAMSGPMLDYAAALQWSKTVGEEAGPDFANAIEWCLRAPGWDDDSWRSEIWSRVVVPLETCHKQVSQKIPF